MERSRVRPRLTARLSDSAAGARSAAARRGLQAGSGPDPRRGRSEPAAAGGWPPPERDRKMGLPGADRTRENHCFGAADELAARQLHELGPRHALELGPIELVERLEVGKARLAQQAARGALVPIGDLGLEQCAQQVLVGPAAVTRAPA